MTTPRNGRGIYSNRRTVHITTSWAVNQCVSHTAMRYRRGIGPSVPFAGYSSSCNDSRSIIIVTNYCEVAPRQCLCHIQPVQRQSEVRTNRP